MGNSRYSVARATILYLITWLPSLALSLIITLAAYRVTGLTISWGSVSFLLAFPAVLLCLSSFWGSAIALIALFSIDLIHATWPHITLVGISSSPIDLQLLIVTVLIVCVAIFSPFHSLLTFLNLIRSHVSNSPQHD